MSTYVCPESTKLLPNPSIDGDVGELPKNRLFSIVGLDKTEEWVEIGWQGSTLGYIHSDSDIIKLGERYIRNAWEDLHATTDHKSEVVARVEHKELVYSFGEPERGYYKVITTENVVGYIAYGGESKLAMTKDLESDPSTHSRRALDVALIAFVVSIVFFGMGGGEQLLEYWRSFVNFLDGLFSP